jgi:hypothetical protein
VDQISGTSPADAEGQPLRVPTGAAVSDSGIPASNPSAAASDSAASPADGGASASGPADRREVDRRGFGARGRARRRARFLRRARELAYRDLGGLVFNLHRFGQRNDALVLAKLSTLTQIDRELRTLESALQEREPVTVLREAGITACPRCAAIHSSEDRFCPNCGLSMARHVDLPIAGASGGATPASAPGVPQPSTTTPPGSRPDPHVPGSSAAPVPNVPAPAPAASAPAGAPSAAPTPPPPPSAQTAPFPARAEGADAPVPARPAEEPTEILRPGAPST